MFTPRQLTKPLRGEITSLHYNNYQQRLPYNCVFCSSCVVWAKVRPRSAKNVVDEVEQVVKKFEIRQIDFSDDNMTLDRQRMMDICDLIIERRIKVEWFTPNGIRADTSMSFAARMKAAGCRKFVSHPNPVYSAL